MKIALFALTVMLMSATAHAQTGAWVTINLEIYQSGAATPFTSIPIPFASMGCNLPTVVPGTTAVTDPTAVAIDDPRNVGRSCVVDKTAFFLSLPAGTGYSATVTVTNDRGETSIRSPKSNLFGRSGVTPPPVLVMAPTGLRVYKPIT